MDLREEYYNQLSQTRDKIRDEILELKLLGIINKTVYQKLRAQLRSYNTTLRSLRNQMDTKSILNKKP
jgi:hypothetical protein